MKINSIPDPNKKQKSAITHPPGPLMILAGAGTGKTFTLENRIIYLINEYKIDPQYILAITYTEKAAKELRARIIDRIGNKAHKITINTFHAFCFQILNEHSESTLPQLLDQSEAIHMLLNRFDRLEPFSSDEFPLDPQKAVTESFIPFFNRIRDELIYPDEIKISAISENDSITSELFNQLKDLARIFPTFQSWKKQTGVVDYGDMILSAYELLSSDKNILNSVQNQFRHIIIDEFQDNNFALNETIGLIAGERKFITAVGDDDQVIYSFRGANSYNIKGFEKRYGEHKDYKSIALEKNYRSTQAILDLANHSISHNVDRMDKTLISSIKSEPIKPVRFWGDKDEQLKFLIKEINHLAAKGNELNDIAILCRTHSQCGKVIHKLNKAGISVLPRRMGLFNISQVRDIIAWCQIITDGAHKETALYRIIKKACGPETTYSIFSQFDKRDDAPRLKLLSKFYGTHPSIKTILNQVRKFREIIRKRSAGEMLWDIAKYLQILKPSSGRYLLDDHFILLNVGNLLKRAQDFTRRNKENNSLYAFNLYIEAMMRSGGLPSIDPPTYRPQNGVVVNTVHGVKGAEFSIVFLPFQGGGSFPLYHRSDKRVKHPPDSWLRYNQNSDLTPKEHHYQEERRLFYVAVTRAKEQLYLLVPERATSQFIKELPDNLMEDQPMTDPDLEIKNYSDLRVQYEQKLQKAISRENFKQAKQLTDALSIIKDHEKGKSISFGNLPWEKKLKEAFSREFIPELPDRINLSASAIETYESCPLKYRLGRIDGIPQAARTPELVFGNIIHRILQRFHEPDKELSLKRILRLLKEEWKSGEFDYTVREEKFKEQGEEMLSRYYDLIQKNIPTVIRREESFAFEIGPITIRGAIDRIDSSPEGTSIIDYKTSKTSSAAKSNLQLAIYSMYLEQLEDQAIGGLPLKASLHFLRDEEKPIRSHTFTSDQIADTKEKIIEVAAGIRNREFEPQTGRHCDWCDYKSLVCHAWEE